MSHSMNDNCQARFYGGCYSCTRCGVTWDIDDTPPECLPSGQLHKNGTIKNLPKSDRESGRTVVKQILEDLKL